MQYESVFGDSLHNVATVSFNMAAERVSTSSVVKLNLSAIKKSDQYVVNIIDNASQVALYKFNGTTQAWVSTAQLIFQFLHVWSWAAFVYICATVSRFWCYQCGSISLRSRRRDQDDWYCSIISKICPIVLNHLQISLFNLIEIYTSAVLNNDIFRLRDCTGHEFKNLSHRCACMMHYKAKSVKKQ